MFKNISLLLVSSVMTLSSVSAHAINQSGQQSKKFTMACSDSVPNLGLVLREESSDSNTIVAEIFFFQGVQNIEFTDKKLAKALKGLPNYLRFEWNRNRCTSPEAYVTNCDGDSDTLTIGDKLVTATGLETLLNLEFKTTGVTQAIKAVVGLDVNGNKFDFPLEFASANCTSKYVF